MTLKEAIRQKNFENARSPIKRSKYGNLRTIVDGIKFDSRKEGARYGELKLHLAAGAIRDLKIHPVFILQEAFVRDRVSHNAITYEADSQYFDIQKNCWIIEDVKALNRRTGRPILTEVYRIKKKLLLKILPPGIAFREFF